MNAEPISTRTLNGARAVRRVRAFYESPSVVKRLSPIGDIPKPTHERQIRPLIGLDPEQVWEAWRKAVAKADELVIKAAV
ncbi:MAG: hypothetical protein ACYDH9_27555, partial [Limisphaerales bacterium]